MRVMIVKSVMVFVSRTEIAINAKECGASLEHVSHTIVVTSSLERS
jgi:hypothetical protein